MNLQFQDSFFKSLKRLSWHESKPYKFYKLFSNDIPLFLKNIWAFRRELWSHRWWDYRFTLELFQRSLKIQEEGISTKGIEIDSSRQKKEIKMRRAIELLQNKLDSNYIDRTEEKYGKLSDKEWKFEKTESNNYILVDEDSEEEKAHNRMIFDKAHRLEEKEWKELWEIIEGKKYKEYKGWDGSDLRTWWD